MSLSSKKKDNRDYKYWDHNKYHTNQNTIQTLSGFVKKHMFSGKMETEVGIYVLFKKKAQIHLIFIQ